MEKNLGNEMGISFLNIQNKLLDIFYYKNWGVDADQKLIAWGKESKKIILNFQQICNTTELKTLLTNNILELKAYVSKSYEGTLKHSTNNQPRPLLGRATRKTFKTYVDDMLDHLDFFLIALDYKFPPGEFPKDVITTRTTEKGSVTFKGISLEDFEKLEKQKDLVEFQAEAITKETLTNNFDKVDFDNLYNYFFDALVTGDSAQTDPLIPQ